MEKKLKNGIDGEDFIPENERQDEDGAGHVEGKAHAALLVCFPVFFAAAAAGLSGGDHACLAEACDEVPVNVADIHADAVDGKGDGAKACRHAGEDDHAGSFAALLSQ